MIYLVFALLLSLISPLLLLPIEKVLPYPHLIEELAKLLIILLIVKAEKTQKTNLWVAVFGTGLLFTISESMLYLSNFLILNNVSFLPLRLLFTGVLHTGTMFLIYLLGKKGYFGLLVGVAGAIGVHYFYNYWISGW